MREHAMREQIFPSNIITIKRREQQTTLENAHGAIDIAKKEDDIAVDFRRKQEFHAPVHENSREKLEEGHTYSKPMPHGALTLDSKEKQQSAVRYEESATSSNEKIMRNLYQLKSKISNQTLEELLPDDAIFARKLKTEIADQKRERCTFIAYHMAQIAKQGTDDGGDGAADTAADVVTDDATDPIIPDILDWLQPK